MTVGVNHLNSRIHLADNAVPHASECRKDIEARRVFVIRKLSELGLSHGLVQVIVVDRAS